MIGVVVIGRNEGARLLACLVSLKGQADRIVYVDSGSRDGSVAAAHEAGAEVVELDPALPFTAARARQAGFEALMAGMPPEAVQFVDGDCTVEPGWLPAARAALNADETLGLVTGWRSEIHPEISVYNRMCDVEWHRPAGPIETCGGDMMVRVRAYRQAGGFDPGLIASEDDEFCLRLAKAGWRLERLPRVMTRHDIAMTRFSEWWRRLVRAGHGIAQVGHMHPPRFARERRRALVFGFILPLVALLGLVTTLWLSLAVVLIYLLSYVRTVRGLCVTEGLPLREALHQSVFLSLSKFPNLIGMALFHWRRLRGKSMRIIEYK
ncbi:Glycosyltransferase, GT2 family [Salinihabitans flavidus]|uniref:Glycosyltransferase, GT2 family n=1 Tax=Salinihabitans flavidus TaxID=569882 RepID=A0A1H8P064_9RHOB|nr:glycosyltransferase family 2 protein [Salinihabitans flavidus]SEO34968.1 Glycosyltransferase, GT2 family [Salinihabitans flavidus]